MPTQLYYKAQQLRELTRQQVLPLCDRQMCWPCLVPPEPAALPLPTGRVCTARRRTSVWRGAAVSRACLIANVPALCVPCGFASVDGQDLPIGLQLAGRPFADGLLLQVAHAYEQSTTWHTRRPPIA